MGLAVMPVTSALSDNPPFAGEPKGAACPAPLGDPPGHPTTRPFGFAALLDLSGKPRRPRENSSLRSSDTLRFFFPINLRYSPA